MPSAIDLLTAKLADDGRLIEAGWAVMKAKMLEGAPPIQVEEMRKAFYFGAQHLFASIVSVLDAGEEPTEQDLDRMSLIDAELKAFIEEMKGTYV